MTLVAAPIQVFELTGSTLMVGVLGLVQFPALFVGSFIGGTLADSRDRRVLLLWSQVLLAVTTAGLALNSTLTAPSTVAVFALTSVNALLSGIDSPARTSTIPRLVPPREVPAAMALQVLMHQASAAVGPAIAGVIIAQWSLAAAYWIDTLTFGAALVAVLLMAPLPPPPDSTRGWLGSIVEGFRFLRTRQDLKGVFLIDVNAMVFGMPRALFPELGLKVFGGTEATVGYLFAAPGVGALIAVVTSGWVGRIDRMGRATTAAVFAWGVAIAGFGFSPWLWPALGLLAVAGAADSLSAVFRNTMLQLTMPDRLRGRLSAVHIAVVAGGPLVGDAEAGAVGEALGPRVAAWSGGLASAVGALAIARALPRFRDWRRPGPAETGDP